jgi:hypothetical protein
VDLVVFAILAALEDIRIGLFLIPPFGATLTVLIESSRDSGRATLRCGRRICCRSLVGTLVSLFSRARIGLSLAPDTGDIWMPDAEGSTAMFSGDDKS